MNLGALTGSNVEFVVVHLVSIDIIVGLLKTFFGGEVIIKCFLQILIEKFKRKPWFPGNYKVNI